MGSVERKRKMETHFLLTESCIHVPRSVLARHYTDFSPERLKEIYDRAGLRILS